MGSRLLLAAAVLLGLPALAHADKDPGVLGENGERDMRLVIGNHLKKGSIQELRAANPGTNRWGANLLMKGDAIEPASDRYFRLDESDYAGCGVDFQATLSTGEKKVLKDVNACTTEFLYVE